MQDNIQLTHADHKPSNKKFPLCLIANDLNSPLNIGSLFRLCDAFGIEKLYLCGDSATPPNSKINKTSRSTEKIVDYEFHKSIESLITSLKEAGTYIISLEITTSSIAINSDEFTRLLKPHKKLCLILGSENTGINKTALALSDITTHIPMFGKNSSMNVITAASIACFEITNSM